MLGNLFKTNVEVFKLKLQVRVRAGEMITGQLENKIWYSLKNTMLNCSLIELFKLKLALGCNAMPTLGCQPLANWRLQSSCGGSVERGWGCPRGIRFRRERGNAVGAYGSIERADTLETCGSAERGHSVGAYSLAERYGCVDGCLDGCLDGYEMLVPRLVA